MTESMPPTRMQLQKMQQAITERVIDRACSDPEWKQQLIEDPQLAMRLANFPEQQQLREVTQPRGGGEVQGQHGEWESEGSNWWGGPPPWWGWGSWGGGWWDWSPPWWGW